MDIHKFESEQIQRSIESIVSIISLRDQFHIHVEEIEKKKLNEFRDCRACNSNRQYDL